MQNASDKVTNQAPAVRGEAADTISRDIVVAVIAAGIRVGNAQAADPEATGALYGRLFNAVKQTISH